VNNCQVRRTNIKKLLIIKTGTSYPAIRNAAGDFDDMIMRKIGMSKKEVIACPVYEKRDLPAVQDIYAVIITGSHDMVTDRAKWSLYLAAWIKEVAFKKVPVLGICYAHQLMAQSFGGEVGYHPRGLEVGSTIVDLTDKGKKDPLFAGLPTSFPVFVGHAQTVTALPDWASVLAYNSFEPRHAVAFGPRTWGLQFHPEFTADIMHSYLNQDKEALQQAGYDTTVLHSSVTDSPYGEIILKRFIELA
jgi:GMP synthase (glutamine-hydrolysing)